jgi:NADH-quinone oxidoreductase subunit H
MAEFTTEDALRSRWSAAARPRAVRWFSGLGVVFVLGAAALGLLATRLTGMSYAVALAVAVVLLLTGGSCLGAAVVVQYPRAVGRLLQRLGLPLFLLAVAAIIVVAWAPVLLWPDKPLIVRDVLAVVGAVGFVSLFASFAIWWERKVAGRIQSRLGPMRVGGWHGWAQSIADGLKLFQKEDILPGGGDAVLFRMAAYVTFVPALSLFIALPFSAAWVGRDLDVGLLLIVALFGLGVIGVLLGGWASNNKWSMYGAMREACQVISYEIPLGFSLLIPIMVAGTLRLTTIGELQAGGFWTWLAFRNPFTLIAALTFLIATLASCKRAPFDLPEAESELVAGYMTEYSGFRWALFMFAEYAEMFAAGALTAILFFGAWHSPLPAAWGAAWATGPLWQQALHGVVFSGPLWLIFKGIFFVYVQIWLRWTLPRIRLDQVMHACVQFMLPVTMVVLLAQTFWQLLVPAGSVLAVALNLACTVLGALVALGIASIAVYGLRYRRRLVGTLVVDHLPGS